MSGDSPVVLDTNVVSLIFNGDWRAEYYEERIEGRRTLITFQTLEEIWFGAFSNGWGVGRREDLRRYLERYDIIWPSPPLVEICARLRSERRAAGRELKNADAWIAAAAILLDCPLASHDRDFRGIPNLTLIRAPMARGI